MKSIITQRGRASEGDGSWGKAWAPSWASAISAADTLPGTGLEENVRYHLAAKWVKAEDS